MTNHKLEKKHLMGKINNFLRDDIYSELLFGVLVLTGPFMAIGLNGNLVAWFVSLSIATIALARLIVRVWYCVKYKDAKKYSHLTFVFLELLFPYAIVISAYIYDPSGEDIKESLWFAALLCLLTLSQFILPKKKGE